MKTNLKPSVQDSWEKLLKPETLRGNLVLASLFIASYEILKDSIIEQIHGFFTNEWNEDGPVVGEAYEEEVLSLHPKKNPFRASIAWLKANQVIDENDERKITELTKHRNEVAHELPKFIADVGKEVQVSAISDIFDLVTKIDRWWIVNVELAIQDEIDPKKVIEDKISSGRMLFLQLLVGITSGEQFTDLHSELVKLHQANRQPASKLPLVTKNMTFTHSIRVTALRLPPGKFKGRAHDGHWHKLDSRCGKNPNGISSLSPGLRGTSYPGYP